MFSADELLNSGKGYVYYYGYGYAGQTQTGAVNFNDFWTQKDANGNYTRPIGAFSPNYIAGYVMDKFNYKDLHFNIGVRVDRFSANTKVLIDPYSLYPEKHVSEVSGASNSVNGGQHPGNMGGNYVVYVGEYRGCCGDEDFFNLLERDFDEHEYERVAIPQWNGVYDFLTVYQRKSY